MKTNFRIAPAVNWNNCQRGDKVHWLVYDATKFPEGPLLCNSLEQVFEWIKNNVATDEEILANDEQEKNRINENAKQLRQSRDSAES